MQCKVEEDSLMALYIIHNMIMNNVPVDSEHIQATESYRITLDGMLFHLHILALQQFKSSGRVRFKLKEQAELYNSMIEAVSQSGWE